MHTQCTSGSDRGGSGSGQGLICSGDAYTHRFDNITSKFANVVRCIDDSLLWEDDLKSSFDLTCRYLSTCSRGGINFNKKIQICAG